MTSAEIKELYSSPEMRKEFPYTALYIEKFGADDLIPTHAVPRAYRTVKGKPAEGLYKHCLKTGKTWRDCVTLPQGQEGKDYII